VSVDISAAGRPGFNSRQRQEMFVPCAVSEPPLGLTQPSIQRVLLALPRGEKQPKHEADHLAPSSVENGASTPAPPHVFLALRS
jgi:hypothetical protein